MKAKELIKQLQKLDPELEVFVNESFSLSPVTYIGKAKVMKTTENMMYIDDSVEFNYHTLDKYIQKPMNTNNEKCIIISRWQP